MDEGAARAAGVAAAREWIGTPYRHMADLRGIGCDCAMLLVRVYCDLGLVEPFDPRPYPRDWMFHRSEERYLRFLLDRATAVAAPQPADIILFRFGRCFCLVRFSFSLINCFFRFEFTFVDQPGGFSLGDSDFPVKHDPSCHVQEHGTEDNTNYKSR